MAELDELEALNEEEELAKLGVGSQALPNVGGGVAVGAQAHVAARSDEDELRQLEAMMAI